MPQLNFYRRFADDVESGKKLQSIRTRGFPIGAPVYLFTGLRTTACKRLGLGTVTKVREVVIDYRNYVPVIKIDGVTLSSKSMEEFARKDGFPGLDEFIDFFGDHYELPLRAFVTEWALVKQEVAA